MPGSAVRSPGPVDGSRVAGRAAAGLPGVTTVLIVEDFRVVADGLQALIEDEPDLRVIGIAADGAEAVRLADDLPPGVALIDYRLPDGTGAEVAARIRRRHPDTAILFLSRDESDVARLSAFESGAAGYLLKSQAAGEVVAAVRSVARGEMLVSSREVTLLLALRHQTTQLLETLTRRELEVLRLMARGTDSRRIGQQLGISYGTVRCHVRNLIAKLGVHSKLEAVNRGLELGLVSSARGESGPSR